MSKNLSKISKPKPFCLPFQARVCATQQISPLSLILSLWVAGAPIPVRSPARRRKQQFGHVRKRDAGCGPDRKMAKIITSEGENDARIRLNLTRRWWIKSDHVAPKCARLMFLCG